MPKLDIFQSMWAMEYKRPDGFELSLEEKIQKISAAGFRLKGGGWYETDFKGSGKKKNLAGEGSAGGSSSAPAT